jgi:hypothetical protein
VNAMNKEGSNQRDQITSVLAHASTCVVHMHARVSANVLATSTITASITSIHSIGLNYSPSAPVIFLLLNN